MINKNEKGIALLIVTTSIVILSIIMIGFSFDSNINKIKSYNIEDRSIAKQTAMAGLKFALTRLEIYKEAFNYLENNDQFKDVANQELINTIWNFPFLYPISKTSKMNKIQKDAVDKFQEGTLLDGQMQLTINNISNKMNLNLLRVDLIKENSEEKLNPPTGQNPDENTDYNIETQLVNTLKNAIESKSQTDEEFGSIYYGNDNQLLANIIKYYVSDKDSIQDPGEAQGSFESEDLTPKYAPMSSMSEIYAFPLWKDDLVELIVNDFTPHGGLMIDLNKVTDKMLKNLFPEISDEDIKDFFEYKNDPKNNVYFNSIDGFKSYFVNKANIISSQDFDTMIEKFKSQGINFGPAASVFKVSSTGVKGRASLTITAYVVLPVQPKKPVKPPTTPTEPVDPDDPDAVKPPTANPATTNPTEPEKQKTQLLNPRVVEIFIE